MYDFNFFMNVFVFGVVVGVGLKMIVNMLFLSVNSLIAFIKHS